MFDQETFKVNASLIRILSLVREASELARQSLTKNDLTASDPDGENNRNGDAALVNGFEVISN